MAINEVNRTHRWHHYPDKPNKTVLRVSQNKQYYINEIKNIIINGFKPSETVVKHRYDRNAKKWRDIAEPKLYPDQYVHHALIQVLKPIMMRGMDKCVCGSIPNRGIHYGKHFIEKWVRNDIKGTKWCLQMDIKHFYPSIQPKYVMARFKSLIKDYKTLDLVERTLKDGVLIGAYYSQWYANTLLQPLDRLIRNIGNNHYIRYADNFTIFSSNKKSLKRTVKLVKEWLNTHSMELKNDWQIFQCKYRLPNALGYRYGRNYTLLRKNTFLTLKRELQKYYRFVDKHKRIPPKLAQGLLSRFGMIKHCNSNFIYKKYVRNNTLKHLKKIVSDNSKKLSAQWNFYLKGGYYETFN